jgi:phosphoribosylformylglycinamidine synthase subunit PurSL
LLISAIGILPDVNQAITMDLKEAGNTLYLIGDFSVEQDFVRKVPSMTLQVYRALHQAIKNGLVRSAHDLSEGGLAVAAAEMCIGGRLGMSVVPTLVGLFTEVNGCLLVEVSPENAGAFESQFVDVPFMKIGSVTSEPILKIANEEISVIDLVQAFNGPQHL